MGQVAPKEDKQRVGQRVGAVRRALNYASEALASQSTQDIQHMWGRADEMEPPRSVVDEQEKAMLRSVVGPSVFMRVSLCLCNWLMGGGVSEGVGSQPAYAGFHPDDGIHGPLFPELSMDHMRCSMQS